MLFCVIIGYDYYVVKTNILFIFIAIFIRILICFFCRERDIEINLRFLHFPIFVKLALCFAPPSPIDHTNDSQYKRKYSIKNHRIRINNNSSNNFFFKKKN